MQAITSLAVSQQSRLLIKGERIEKGHLLNWVSKSDPVDSISNVYN
jgi:hypothetical protein